MKVKRSLGAIGLALTLSIDCLGQNAKQIASLRSILLKELRTTHNQTEWFVPIDVAVDGMTAKQASWQPSGGGHSAGQITYHLLFWNRRNLERFSSKRTRSVESVR